MSHGSYSRTLPVNEASLRLRILGGIVVLNCLTCRRELPSAWSLWRSIRGAGAWFSGRPTSGGTDPEETRQKKSKAAPFPELTFPTRGIRISNWHCQSLSLASKLWNCCFWMLKLIRKNAKNISATGWRPRENNFKQTEMIISIWYFVILNIMMGVAKNRRH